MSQKNLSRTFSLFHFHNSGIGISFHIHFIRFIIHRMSSIKRLILKLIKWVFNKITIAYTNICIFQFFSCKINTFNVIFYIKRIINDKFNTILIFQIIEHFLFISEYNRNIFYSSLMKLLNLAFYQTFTFYFK